MQQVKKIKVLEAENPYILLNDDGERKKLRVCAYARVSTNDDDQINSFDNQVNEYTNRIESNPDWKFSGIYADKGISGTQIKRRESFKRMVDDAVSGKIDMILTKSISRFGRNTVEVLETVRLLREKNVVIYFEKENISSDDNKLDFILTIMSSIAQEESRSISENIKWSVKKRFSEGKMMLNYTSFLGYTKNEDGDLVIVPEEAKIIEMIYSNFLRGLSAYEISKLLMDQGLKTKMGNSKWTTRSVMSILQNEKYCGDALLHKTYTVDYLSGKSVPNDNIVDKYFVENSHPGIISKEDHKTVQNLIRKRDYENEGYKKNSLYPLTNLVYCSECKRPMKRHIHNYGRKSEKIVLNCKHSPQIKINCSQNPIDNELMLSAIDNYVTNIIDVKSINNNVLEALERNMSTEATIEKINKLKNEINESSDELNELVKDSNVILNSDIIEIEKNYKSLKQVIDRNKQKITELELKVSTSSVNEHKLELIKEFTENKFKLSNSAFIKYFIKMILVTPDHNVMIIHNDNPILRSDLLKDFTLLNNATLLHEATHYDKELNQNISYKVVSLEYEYTES